MSPKVSVIIPVYNLENYLDDGLESIINQTLKDIEVIIVNDGSTDNSLHIIKKYSRKDDRVKIINLKENNGQSVARNEGLKKANGEYVYFFDGDDILKTNALVFTYNEAKKNNLDVVNFNAETLIDNKNIKFYPNYNRGDKIPSKIFNGDEFFDFLIFHNLFKASVPLNLIRRKFIIENNLKFEEGIIHEDVLYTTKLFILADKVKYIKNVFYKRRVRYNSTMTSKRNKNNLDSLITVEKSLYKFYLKNYREESLKLKLCSILSSIITVAIKINKLEDYENIISRELEKLDDSVNLPIKLKFNFPNLYSIYLKMKNYFKKY